MTSPTSPIVPLCRYCGPSCTLYGYCHCGCGERTKLCRQDAPKDNWIKGTPMRYLRHHHRRNGWFSDDPFPVFERPEGVAEGYCWCKCGERAPIATQTIKRLGVKEGEPFRYIKFHHIPPDVPQYIEEFKSKNPLVVTACWIWQWAKSNGYGVLANKEGSRLAHVIMYEKHRGPVPEGLDLDHLCKVPACVNPYHLEAVTHRVNMERGKNSKLSHEKAEEIRVRKSRGESTKSLAVFYGVDTSTILGVCRFDTWIR